MHWTAACPSRTSFLVATIFSSTLAIPGAAQDYQRAEQFLTWNLLRNVYHDHVAPTWYQDSTRFWYRVATADGPAFLTVDPRAGSQNPLFDNARLAAALGLAADTAIDPVRLPLQQFSFDDDGRNDRAIRFKMGERGFRCDIGTYQCAEADTLESLTPYVRSPDDQWEAFAHEYDIWIRPAAGGDSVQITTDGEEYHAYGVGVSRPGQVRAKLRSAPQVTWSPDSRRMAVARIDERNVESFHVVSSTTTRPQHYSFPYALPGDTIIPTVAVHILDVESRSNTPVEADPQTQQSFYAFGQTGFMQWSAGSDQLYFTHVDRGPKRVQLLRADASSGAVQTVMGDSSSSYVMGAVDLIGGGTNWRVLRNGDVVWFSQRNGWAHLYRFGADGTRIAQLTDGPWTVSSVLHVDEDAGRLFFTARSREAGRHPDYVHLYAVNLDGTRLTLLTPEDADHWVTAVPTGGYFIDTYSRVDQPTVTVLRDADGEVIRELQRADVSELEAIGWRPGEIFTTKARDGVTDIYGVMWKPSHFDSTRQYPVIDHIYPGPLISPVPKFFFPTRQPFAYSTMGQVQALAELGFIVVSIDALGNVPRAKAVHTRWYGNMGDNGIPDHVAAIQQLAARHAWMDIERVGIYGHSGGGFASTDALLRYPNFYKVAVSTAGNHDNRTYYYGWGERFQGLLERDTLAGTDNYEAAANRSLVGNLKGRLLLMHGDLDDNVHPAMSIQMADALIKANKPFDFLIIPDANHGLTQHPYVIRRTWDYFVEHLLGAEPVYDYAISPPPTP